MVTCETTIYSRQIIQKRFIQSRIMDSSRTTVGFLDGSSVGFADGETLGCVVGSSVYCCII